MIQYGCLLMMHGFFFHWMIKGMLKHWICLNIKTPKLLKNTLGFVLLWNLSYVNLIKVIYLGVVCSSHSSSPRKKKKCYKTVHHNPHLPLWTKDFFKLLCVFQDNERALQSLTFKDYCKVYVLLSFIMLKKV